MLARMTPMICCNLHVVCYTHPSSTAHILYTEHTLLYTHPVHTSCTLYTHPIHASCTLYTHPIHTSCTHLLCIHPVHTCALYTLLYTHLVRCTHAPVRCTHILYTVRCTHDPEHTLGEWRHLRDTSHGFLAQASYPRSFKGRGARGRAPNTRPS
jgi:hypothetical protein